MLLKQKDSKEANSNGFRFERQNQNNNIRAIYACFRNSKLDEEEKSKKAWFPQKKLQFLFWFWFVLEVAFSRALRIWLKGIVIFDLKFQFEDTKSDLDSIPKEWKLDVICQCYCHTQFPK